VIGGVNGSGALASVEKVSFDATGTARGPPCRAGGLKIVRVTG